MRTSRIAIAVSIVASMFVVASTAPQAEAARLPAKYSKAAPAYDGPLLIRLAETLDSGVEGCQAAGVALVNNSAYDHKIWWASRDARPLRTALAHATGRYEYCNWINSDAVAGRFSWSSINLVEEARLDTMRARFKKALHVARCKTIYSLIGLAAPIPGGFKADAFQFTVEQVTGDPCDW